ncbi:hypothetical protein F3Y22_tig00110017pilonHSYRG00180 [Hibiscus syriacus]|uniref:RNase H type-1 domain-containing protein n=1 Tax=Hibiscus syriacus TaxID=106335 RepID=A0A6A3BPH1_HIBSY|nr:hypothetical protein F3Y22_tig00110017pilonHSYRG00180 [Hibiscus syriacus]
MPGRICVNTDGAAANNFMQSAAGGSFGDCDGNWQLGFIRSIDYCSPLQSEQWGILTGLSIAWNEKIIIQSDCFIVVRLINEGDDSDSNRSLIRAIWRARWTTHLQASSAEGHAWSSLF